MFAREYITQAGAVNFRAEKESGGFQTAVEQRPCPGWDERPCGGALSGCPSLGEFEYL